MNGYTEIAVEYSVLDIRFLFDVGRSMFDVRRSSFKMRLLNVKLMTARQKSFPFLSSIKTLQEFTERLGERTHDIKFGTVFAPLKNEVVVGWCGRFMAEPLNPEPLNL